MNQASEQYERLIRPIEDQMMRVVWGVTRDADDADEALQEALSTIWRKWDRIARHPNPTALVLRMCHNAAYDVLRRKIRRRHREPHAEATMSTQPPTPAEAAVNREQESAVLDAIGRLSRQQAQAVNREQESAVLEAIGRLSRQQAQAVTLRLVEGESYSAIGRILGCKDSTARKHVERGRERLRMMLAPWVAEMNGETCNEAG